MKKTFYIAVSFIFVFLIAGCSIWQQNYGKLATLPKDKKEVTIQNLIDQWDDYNIYYAGQGIRFPLGIIFDQKNDDTMLVGDRWKKVESKKTLIEIVRWIYPYTNLDPWISRILGPDDRFYGYIYYSYGSVILKMVGDKKMYVFDLEEPHSGEGLGDTVSK